MNTARCRVSNVLLGLHSVTPNNASCLRTSEANSVLYVASCCRRMFPVLTVTLTGLHPDSSYDVMLDMIPVDGLRYRYSYHRSTWLPTGRIDGRDVDLTRLNGGDKESMTFDEAAAATSAPYRHASSPLTGGRRMTASDTTLDSGFNWQTDCRTIAFDRLKLTNCPYNDNRHVSVSRDTNIVHVNDVRM